ncbi:hypothetical protein Tco_0078021, partial [Tanacetum coccineum]
NSKCDSSFTSCITSTGAKVISSKTAEQKLAKEKWGDLKRQKALFMLAIPDDPTKIQCLQGLQIPLREAIKNRFGGNKESKKLSKLLRSLPSAWNNIALIMRNKSDLDTLSMDDLYNNLKVYESEIKGKSSSSSNSQNVAFVSSDNSSSTNETVNTAHSVSAASSKDQASTASYVDDVMFSFFSNQSNAPQLDYEDLEQIDADDLEENGSQMHSAEEGITNFAATWPRQVHLRLDSKGGGSLLMVVWERGKEWGDGGWVRREGLVGGEVDRRDVECVLGVRCLGGEGVCGALWGVDVGKLIDWRFVVVVLEVKVVGVWGGTQVWKGGRVRVRKGDWGWEVEVGGVE